MSAVISVYLLKWKPSDSIGGIGANPVIYDNVLICFFGQSEMKMKSSIWPDSLMKLENILFCSWPIRSTQDSAEFTQRSDESNLEECPVI